MFICLFAVHVIVQPFCHFKIRLCFLTLVSLQVIYSASKSYVDCVIWKCDVEHLFVCPLVIYVSFVKYLFKSFTLLHFLLILSYQRPLYILSTNHLSDICVVNIFFLILSLYFHFLIVLFAEQKSFILMFILLIMSLIYHAFRDMSKKYLANFKSWRFSPIFSSRNFIVLNFIIKALIWFELFFV